MVDGAVNDLRLIVIVWVPTVYLSLPVTVNDTLSVAVTYLSQNTANDVCHAPADRATDVGVNCRFVFTGVIVTLVVTGVLSTTRMVVLPPTNTGLLVTVVVRVGTSMLNGIVAAKL